MDNSETEDDSLGRGGTIGTRCRSLSSISDCDRQRSPEPTAEGDVVAAAAVVVFAVAAAVVVVGKGVPNSNVPGSSRRAPSLHRSKAKT